MERLFKLMEKFKEESQELIELMEIFDENPTQAGRNEIIRKMAVFNRDKNTYMSHLKDIILKGNEKVNLRTVNNYNKTRKK